LSVGYVINITHGRKHTQNIPCTRRQFVGGTLWTAASSLSSATPVASAAAVAVAVAAATEDVAGTFTGNAFFAGHD
jgi:hypothetical protein